MYGMYTFGRFFWLEKFFVLVWVYFQRWLFNKKKGGHFKELFENGRIRDDSWPFQNTYAECLAILRFADLFVGEITRKWPFGKVLQVTSNWGIKRSRLESPGIGCLYLGLRRSQANGMERGLIMWIFGAQFALKPDACTPSREGKGFKRMKRCFRWRALKSGGFSSKPMILIMNDVPLFLWRVWCEELEAKPQRQIWHESLTWTLRGVPNGLDLGCH